MTPGITFTPSASRWLRGEHLFWPIDKWQAFQQAELTLHLARAAATPLYHGRIKPAADFSELPLTTKDDLSTHHSSLSTHHSNLTHHSALITHYSVLRTPHSPTTPPK
jgi:hypothetical protein